MANDNTTHVATPSSLDALSTTFITERQLAARHKRNPKTLRNDRIKGVYVPFHAFGRQVRYRLSDVIAYERTNRVPRADTKADPNDASTGELREETFLTPRELAERHQRSEKTLRNDRVHRRHIPFYKLGGQVRYALSDVVAFEHETRATSTTAAQSSKTPPHALPRSGFAHHGSSNVL